MKFVDPFIAMQTPSDVIFERTLILSQYSLLGAPVVVLRRIYSFALAAHSNEYGFG